MNGIKTTKCKLCHKENVQLCDSHIIPEFIYRNSGIYNEDHRYYMINIDDSYKKIEQKGIRDNLLCKDCEVHINLNYERPVCNKMFQNDQSYLKGYDYDTLKGFILSIIFKMSISNKKEGNLVSLGPYEDVIRKILLTKKIPPSDYFPMMKADSSRIPVISSPTVFRIKGRLYESDSTKYQINRLFGYVVYHFYFAGSTFITLIGGGNKYDKRGRPIKFGNVKEHSCEKFDIDGDPFLSDMILNINNW